MSACLAAAALLWTPCGAEGSSPFSRKGARHFNEPEKPSAVRLHPSTWHAERLGDGPVRIEISLERQLAWLYAGNSLVGEVPISSGRPGHETPVGQYTVLAKHRDHRSNLYGSFVDASGKFLTEASAAQKAPAGAYYQSSPMPHFLRLTWSGVGLHGGFVNGSPISRGCMRLPYDMAERFFAAAQTGTPVVIRP